LAGIAPKSHIQFCGQDFQRSQYQRFGIAVTALGTVEFCQIVEAGGDSGMVWAQLLFSDRQ
jgi:hypothetical protein